MHYDYPITLERHADGDWTVQFPDIPEAITGGASREEALGWATDCLETALAGRLKYRQPIPAPSPAEGRPTASPGTLIAAKLALHQTMLESAVTDADLATRLGIRLGAIRRLLNPRQETPIDKIECALAALNRRLVVTIEDVN